MYRFLFCTALICSQLATVEAIAAIAARDSQRRECHTQTIYEFPLGTWVENIAVRATGSLLLTTLTSPSLYVLDPLSSTPAPAVVGTIPGATALLGIAEVQPDVFAIVAGSGEPDPTSFSIWSVDLGHHNWTQAGSSSANASVSKIADLPEAKLLNGMTLASPGSDYLLVADTFKGVVWQVDTRTGASAVVFSDPVLAPPGPGNETLGVNGLHSRASRLYFTNTAARILGSVQISADGVPQGATSVLAHGLTAEERFDDFTFGGPGNGGGVDDFNVYLATQSGNSIERMSVPAGAGFIVAGNLNSTALAQPTSCAFGRTPADAGTLYVTTGGGLTYPVDGNITIGGQVVAVKVDPFCGG